MSNQRVPEEIIVRGTLSTLGPILYTIAQEQGLVVAGGSGRPNSIRSNWDFASYTIYQPAGIDSMGGAIRKNVGAIRLQGLPDEKTLITFVKTVRGKLPGEEAQKEFEYFCVELIQRLVQLGFLEVRPPPKRKIGFVGKN